MASVAHAIRERPSKAASAYAFIRLARQELQNTGRVESCVVPNLDVRQRSIALDNSTAVSVVARYDASDIAKRILCTGRHLVGLEMQREAGGLSKGSVGGNAQGQTAMAIVLGS